MLKYCIDYKYYPHRQVSVLYFKNDCVAVVVKFESYAIKGESWSNHCSAIKGERWSNHCSEPATHAPKISLRTQETLKERGMGRVEKYPSVLITIKLFIVTEGHSMFK